MKNEKTILITGTTSGIGKALLEILAGESIRILSLSRSTLAWDSSRGAQAQVLHRQVDFGSEMEVASAIDWIKKETDQLDVFFNNAGVSAHGRFEELALETYQKTFQVNFFSPIQLVRGVVPLLKKGRGVVVTTSTVSALYGIPGRAAYSSSKAALHAAMETFRIEHKKDGIRSALVAVPYTETGLRSKVIGADGKIHPEGQAKTKLKTPEEVARKLIQVSQMSNPRLVTMSLSGRFVEWMRFLSPSLLEQVLSKKLKSDFDKGSV